MPDNKEIDKSAGKDAGANKDQKASKKSASKAKPKKPATVKVKNTSGVSLHIGGVTVKNGQANEISKVAFEAFKRGTFGHSLVSASKVSAK